MSTRRRDRWDLDAHPEQTDACVAAIRRGDADAFDALAAHCHSQVRAQAVRDLDPWRLADIQDVLQETAVTAWMTFDKYREESAPCTWMVGIAKGIARNLRRKLQRRRRRVEIVGDPLAAAAKELRRAALEKRFDLADGLTTQDLRQWILEELPSDEYRQTYLLRYVEELSYQEIADRLQIAEGTVAVRLNRIRAVIRRVYPRRFEE